MIIYTGATSIYSHEYSRELQRMLQDDYDELKFSDTHNRFSYILEKALTRTYILYYQGIPEEFNFNDNTKEFNAIFQYDKSIEKPSVIYINKDFNYKNNYKLTITDIEGKELEGVTVTENGNYIEVLINNEDKIKVKVNLKAL